MKRRFTFNANLSEIGDFEKFLRTLIAWQPEWVVLMNGIGGNEYRRVRETMDTWGGKIIYRHYEESDGHLWRSRTASEHINLLKSLKAIDPKAWFIVSNEPLPDDSEREKMQKFHADVIKGAVENGIRLCVGNLAIAAMGDKKDIDGGRWDALLRAIGERANLKAEGICQIMLGIHTYTHAIAPLHCAGKDPRDMTNPQKAAIWPTPAEVYTTPEDNWLVFRGDWFVQRIKTLTGNLVDVADTECTKDRMPNIVLQFAATVAEIDRLAKREVRGLPTLPEFYKVVFPQWTPAQAECEQMLWWEDVHPAYYRCFALFTWNHNVLWKRDYDLSGMDEFLTLWPTYKTTPTPPPPPPVSDLPTEGWVTTDKLKVFAWKDPATIYRTKEGNEVVGTVHTETGIAASTVYMFGVKRQPVKCAAGEGWIDTTKAWFSPSEPPFVIEPGDPRWKQYRFFTNGQTATVYQKPGPGTRIGDLHVGGVIVDHIPHELLTPVERTYVMRAQGVQWLIVQLSVGGIGFVREREATRRELIDAPVPPPPADTVTIPKTEYEDLLDKAEKLIQMTDENIRLTQYASEFDTLKFILSKPSLPKEKVS
jgi:hypothetical protein